MFAFPSICEEKITPFLPNVSSKLYQSLNLSLGQTKPVSNSNIPTKRTQKEAVSNIVQLIAPLFLFWFVFIELKFCIFTAGAFSYLR